MVPLLIEDQSRFNYNPTTNSSPENRYSRHFCLPHEQDGLYHLIPERDWAEGSNPFLMYRVKQGQNHQPEVQDKANKFLLYLQTHHAMPTESLHDWQIDACLSPIFGPKQWHQKFPLSALNQAISRSFPHVKSGQHQDYFPVDVTIDGLLIPGIFVNHHTAHAASTY